MTWTRLQDTTDSTHCSKQCCNLKVVAMKINCRCVEVSIHLFANPKPTGVMDPENKKIIVCEKKLKKFFGGKVYVGFVEIAGLINPHFLKRTPSTVCKSSFVHGSLLTNFYFVSVASRKRDSIARILTIADVGLISGSVSEAQNGMEFILRSRVINSEQFCKDKGSCPLKLLFSRCNDFRYLKYPIDSGICPSSIIFSPTRSIRGRNFRWLGNNLVLSHFNGLGTGKSSGNWERVKAGCFSDVNIYGKRKMKS
ncbi:SWIB/MDM2 domain [Dillenia turbinata]|uniref:SWIB/MDM2 domain n=1 Tax=Dillenia turbinata TaxID=194707 RepID=A0AAN8UGG6_9MAGN